MSRSSYNFVNGLLNFTTVDGIYAGNINATHTITLTGPRGYQGTSGYSGTVPGVNLGANWTITASGSYLYFAYAGTNYFSLDTSGNFVAVSNVTAYGTP